MARFDLQRGFGILPGALDDGGIGLFLPGHAVGEQSAGGEGQIVRAGGRLCLARGIHILAARELCGELD